MTLYNTKQTSVAVTATSIQLVAANTSRRVLIFMNVGASPVTIVPGTTAAVSGTGLVLGTAGSGGQGGSILFDGGVGTAGSNGGVPTDAFQVICASGLTSTVIVWER